MHILLPVPDNWGTKGRRNYFMTNLHERMLPGQKPRPSAGPVQRMLQKQKETEKKRVKKKSIQDYETTTDKIIQTHTYNKNIDYVDVTN